MKRQTDNPKQVMSRRRVIYLAGAGTAGLVLASCSSDSDESRAGSTGPTGTSASSDAPEASGTTPDCVLTPEEIEGPFYTDVNLVRRDITDGRPGSPLEMRITVVDADTCAPISDATVDIWHADAGGLYSAFTGQGDDADIDTSSESFLRGVQATDGAGLATFNTIYPGWYGGRTTHIHTKVHFADQTRVTTQLYFPDETTNKVYDAGPAYQERGGKDTSNDDDDFGASDPSLQMTLEQAADGHIATHIIGIRRN